MEDFGCSLGFLVCPKKPRKDRFLIGKNKIIILDHLELDKIPKIVDGAVGQW